MFKDVIKFSQIRKLKAKREEEQEIPEYRDRFENLNNLIHPGSLKLKVSEIFNLNHNTKLYRLVPIDSKSPLPPFRAGQYICISVDINGVNTVRPYSIVSSPNQHNYYEIAVKKKVNGFVSIHLIDNLKQGDLVKVTEPMGNFYYNNLFHGNELVFIAGGCGITPFISMLRDIFERTLTVKTFLLFGCLSEEDMLFRDELEDFKKMNPNFSFKFVLSEPSSKWKGECGFISRETIKDFISTVGNKYFYVVGNRAMNLFIRKQLEELGVYKHKILYESYGIPENVKFVPGWPKELDENSLVSILVKYSKDGRKIIEKVDARCLEPILISLERSEKLNFLLDSGCRSGSCGLCRTKLISGKVFVPPDVLIREVDQKYSFIHPCISYPLGDLYLDLTLNERRF